MNIISFGLLSIDFKNGSKFPNDGCTASTGSYGVCYTASECATLSGTASGSCASGFGVCCTFTGGCGASTDQNNTYFSRYSTHSRV